MKKTIETHINLISNGPINLIVFFWIWSMVFHCYPSGLPHSSSCLIIHILSLQSALCECWSLLLKPAQVGPGCVSVSLSDRARYPYFTRMAPSLRFNVVAVYEVLQFLGYQRVGIIYGYRSINNLVKDLFLEMMASDNAAGSYSWTHLYTYQVKSVADAQAAVAMAASKDSRTRICVAIQSLQICFVYFCLSFVELRWPEHMKP